MEVELFLEGFQSIVSNGAIRRPIGHFPHSGNNRPVTSDQMWKVGAGHRPGVVDGTKIPIEEDATLLRSFEDQAFLVAVFAVAFEEAIPRNADELGQRIHLA